MHVQCREMGVSLASPEMRGQALRSEQRCVRVFKSWCRGREMLKVKI